MCTHTHTHTHIHNRLRYRLVDLHLALSELAGGEDVDLISEKGHVSNFDLTMRTCIGVLHQSACRRCGGGCGGGE
jgi:hypothetical protein